MKKFFSVSVLTLLLALSFIGCGSGSSKTPITPPSGPTPPTQQQPLTPERALLKEAFQCYDKYLMDLCSNDDTKVLDAINIVKEKFQKVIDNFPNGECCDDAQFFIGQVVARTKNAILARQEYQKVIDLYPNERIS